MDISTIKDYGLIRYLLDNGATIAPLELEFDENTEMDTLASMNPSIWIDNNTCYINIRAVNYNLFNTRYREYTQTDQPLAYVCHEETALKTENYFGTLDLDTLKIEDISKVEMMKLHEPVWYFTGLEDARIIKWDDDIYLCGVRRDTKENGEGRMELSKIEYINGKWQEIKRTRMPAAGDDTAYLEKNWMPIVDRPWWWLKWSSPIEFAHYDIDTGKLEIVFNGNSFICFRGDSHLVNIDGDYYCFVHDCINYRLREETNARMGVYVHYIMKFDKDLNYLGKFGPFMYDNRFNVEFGCGLAIKDDYCYLVYSENDAISVIIKFHKKNITELSYEI